MSANGKSVNGNGSAAAVTPPAAGGAPAAAGSSLLKFEHVVRKTSPGYSLDTRVLDQLDRYAEYIKALTGHAPPKDEVVEKALQHVFDLDAGFKRFVSSGSVGRSAGKKLANQPAGAAGGDAEPGAAGRAAAQNA